MAADEEEKVATPKKKQLSPKKYKKFRAFLQKVKGKAKAKREAPPPAGPPAAIPRAPTPPRAGRVQFRERPDVVSFDGREPVARPRDRGSPTRSDGSDQDGAKGTPKGKQKGGSSKGKGKKKGKRKGK